jgi:ribonuclease D
MPAPDVLGDHLLVADPSSLDALTRRLAGAPRIALDVEADGLHAFRPKLCTLQIAWTDGAGVTRVAVVDALAVGVGALGDLLGEGGPIKVLHDLTFDAKMLEEAGLRLARVRDTSVAARFLGCPATGLGALLEAELGVKVEKRFQQHDWAERPLTAEQLRYLTDDVAHLFALDDHLEARAANAGIVEEIADECAYKLGAASAPPRDGRPAYVRIKGAAALDRPGRAVLRRLVEARDRVAERADVPPFKVIGNDVLLEIARRRPATATELRAVRGSTAGRAARALGAMLEAVLLGVQDGDVPADDQALFEPARPDRALVARRRACEARVSGWRRAEAKRRGVDEQVVLPGHCAQDVTDALLEHAAAGAPLRAALEAIPGLGDKRAARYLDALAALADPATAAQTSAAPAGEAPTPRGDGSA